MNSISLLNFFNEFQLFKYLENNLFLFPKIFIGKVEINKYPKNNFISIDKSKKIFKLENHIINKYSFELFKICLIINYEITQNNEILLNNESFIHLSSQKIYFNDLLLNYFSVIRFYIHDFKNNNNFYSKIEV